MLCATPIGNLADISKRLAETLRDADVVFAEDTRRSRVLLESVGAATPLRSFFVGNESERLAEIEQRLGAGETVALVTDAGTPAVSDPGYSAVRAARRAGAVVTVVPGPSAVTSAIAVSGLPSERFVFEGFLPRKSSVRAARLDQLATEPRTIVLFAATGRVADDLADLGAALGPDRSVVVVRELTKVHEEVWEGTLGTASDRWREREPRGEFTLVVAGAPEVPPDMDAAITATRRLVASGTPLSEAVRTIAAEHGVRRRDLYDAALQSRDNGD